MGISVQRPLEAAEGTRAPGQDPWILVYGEAQYVAVGGMELGARPGSDPISTTDSLCDPG